MTRRWFIRLMFVPLILTAMSFPLGHSATLKWKASDQPVNYRVYRATALRGPYTQIAASIKVLTYKDTTVISGQTYYYRVSARNPTTNLVSPYSNVVKAVIP